LISMICDHMAARTRRKELIELIAAAADEIAKIDANLEKIYKISFNQKGRHKVEMNVILAYCNCENKCQDMIYGKGMRVHNLMNDGKRHKTTGFFECQCAVCSTVRKVG